MMLFMFGGVVGFNYRQM